MWLVGVRCLPFRHIAESSTTPNDLPARCSRRWIQGILGCLAKRANKIKTDMPEDVIWEMASVGDLECCDGLV